MNHEAAAGPDDGWPVVVKVPVEPVEAAVEADARDAAARSAGLAVRGPLFGVAAQSEEDGRRWRVVLEVTQPCPQEARDGLNSLLWFRAKDETDDREERRALLAAVARLETEPVDELTVLGTRYRVVRAEEYTGVDAHGSIEGPRPTDPEPLVLDWRRGARDPKIDDGLVLDPDAPLTPAQAGERLSLRSLSYAGEKFPEAVLNDSERARETHPDVVLMPALFRVVERTGTEPWALGGGLHATPHDTRRALDFSLVWWEPRRLGLISDDPERDVLTPTDARTVVAEGTDPAVAQLAVFAEAADRVRAERLDQIEVRGTVYRVGRTRRLLRWGPDGPEGPRPSDVSDYGPTALHPPMDEDGTVLSGKRAPAKNAKSAKKGKKAAKKKRNKDKKGGKKPS